MRDKNENLKCSSFKIDKNLVQRYKMESVRQLRPMYRLIEEALTAYIDKIERK